MGRVVKRIYRDKAFDLSRGGLRGKIAAKTNKLVTGSWMYPGLQVHVNKRPGTDVIQAVLVEDRFGRYLGLCPHCDRTWWYKLGEEPSMERHGLTLECLGALRNHKRMCQPKEDRA